MRLDEQRFSHHIELIYDASLNPRLWPNLLRDLCNDIGATCGVIHVRDSITYEPLIAVESGVDPEGMNAYADYFYQCDVWAKRLYKIKEGCASLGEKLVSDTDMTKTEFLNDFLRKYAGPHAMLGIPVRSESLDSNFTLVRRANDGPFHEDQLEYFLRLMPHIKRAFYVGLKLANIHSEKFIENLSCLNDAAGAVLVGHKGLPIFINDAANKAIDKIRNSNEDQNKID